MLRRRVEIGRIRRCSSPSIGCSPAWPNAGRRAVRLSRRGRGPAAPRLRPRRARAPAQGRRRLAARRRRRDHALPPRPLGRPRAVDLRRELRPGTRGPSRPSSGCRPAERTRLRRYGEQMSFAGQIDGAFSVREYEDGEPFRAAGFDVTAAAARALLRADLRPARQQPQQHARVLRRHRPEPRPRRARARRRRLPLRGDAARARARRARPPERGRGGRGVPGVGRAPARRHPPSRRAAARPDGRARADGDVLTF